jgi:ribose-phosphate pyrophosphokinase
MSSLQSFTSAEHSTAPQKRGGLRIAQGEKPMTNGRSCVVISGSSHQFLGAQIASALDVPSEPATIGSFADGETRVHIEGDVRNSTVFLVQPTGPPVNDSLMVLALLADACHAGGAGRVIAVVPYFGYSRQDQRGSPGDPRSAQVAAKLLASVGVDHLITIDLHSPALESAFAMPITNVPAIDVFRPFLQALPTYGIVVSPDAGGIKRAQQFAAALRTRVVAVTKHRTAPDSPVVESVLGDVRDQTCLIVDDMASTGRTMTGAAEALIKAGARSVDAVFTHAVMARGAMERLLESPIKRFIVSDTLPGLAATERLSIQPISAVIARVIHEVFGKF